MISNRLLETNGVVVGEWAMSKEYETVDSSGAVVVNSVRPTPPLRQIVRTKRVELTGDYAGWHATVRTNAPVGLFLNITQLNDRDEGANGLTVLAGLIAILPSLVIAWNFVDEDGLPLPCTRAGMERLPTDLFMALVNAFTETTGSEGVVPKS